MAQEMDALFSNSKALQRTMEKSSKLPKVLYSNRSLTSFLMVANSTRLAIIGVFFVILGYFGSSFYGLHKCSPIEVFGESPRHKAMAFVGIHTGFSSLEMRNALRETWMPSDLHGLRRLEESTSLAIRFVIGRSSTRPKMEALEEEIQKYDDFLLLDVEENDVNLPLKTLAFFKEAYRLYDSDFYVKLNDGVYLRPDRLSLLLAKYRPHSLSYIGCMKNGEVVGDPKHKWYDTFHHLLNSEYFLHAHGAMYALSSDIVSTIVSMRNDSFRLFNNENVLIGSWMLAMNVNHEHEKELCQTQCTTSSIAVWNISCSGVCHPEQQLIELHKMDICSKSPTMASSD